MPPGRFPAIFELTGLTGYLDALQLQQALHRLRLENHIPDTIVSLQHESVFTLGRRARREEFHSDEAAIRANVKAEIVEVPRGGEATWHGPGQAVLYPIVHLRQAGLGPRRYVELLEQAMIRTAADFGIEARPGGTGRTGVWVEDRKLGAIGVQISRGVTMHGLAFNIAPDLDNFGYIKPCGLQNVQVTSLALELGSRLDTQGGADMAERRLLSHLRSLLFYRV
mmetsp:Transcript_3286/g.11921  ORF Transcript_3286/g.11921 Transcript_3286/m.11921 type:complete len:224 (-) Transcript_3286:504-1175(-)